MNKLTKLFGITCLVASTSLLTGCGDSEVEEEIAQYAKDRIDGKCAVAINLWYENFFISNLSNLQFPIQVEEKENERFKKLNALADAGALTRTHEELKGEKIVSYNVTDSAKNYIADEKFASLCLGKYKYKNIEILAKTKHDNFVGYKVKINYEIVDKAPFIDVAKTVLNDDEQRQFKEKIEKTTKEFNAAKFEGERIKVAVF